MAAQILMKAALPLAKYLATASYHVALVTQFAGPGKMPLWFRKPESPSNQKSCGIQNLFWRHWFSVFILCVVLCDIWINGYRYGISPKLSFPRYSISSSEKHNGKYRPAVIVTSTILAFCHRTFLEPLQPIWKIEPPYMESTSAAYSNELHWHLA